MGKGKFITVIIAVFLLVALIIPLAGLFYADYVVKLPYFRDSFIITAHTGCENTKENSLESITAGIKGGADAIEFDIRFLDDGTPILCHDEKDKGIKNVKLESAFNLLYTYAVKINLDLKETTHLDKVATLISFYNLEDRCYFTGVDKDKVAAVKSMAPDIAFYLNIKLTNKQKNNALYIEEIGQTAKSLGAIGINLNFRELSKENSNIWHSQGLLVSAYTLNLTTDIYLALNKNVDNITTLKPAKIVALVR